MRADLAALRLPDDLATDLDSYTDLLAEQQFGLRELAELTQTPGRVRRYLLGLDAVDAPRLADGLGLDACVAVDDAIVTRTVMLFDMRRN